MIQIKTLFFASTLALLTALPAQAQSKAELAAEDARLAQRLSVLEQRFLTGDPAAAQLMQRTDALETTLRNLTGEIEQLRYERQNLRSEVEALAGDLRAMQALSNRMEIHLNAVDLVAAERGRPVASSPVTSGLPPANMPPFGTVQQGSSVGGSTSFPSTPQAPDTRQVTIPAQEQFAELSQLPNAGRTKLAEGDFSGAQSDFERYLALNPDAPDAGEIQYWLGESYYVRGNYADAADAYIQSMRKDGRGERAPDSMVRLAASLRELGNVAEACQTLRSFPAQYPNADARVKDKARTEQARTAC